MYKIIGGDGKEYGPVTVNELRDWLRQRRINRQTRVKSDSNTQWQTAAEVAELADLFAPAAAGQGVPPVIAPRPVHPPQKGLAVLSFVLGLTSLALCLGVLTGVPAIICGHVARKRAVRWPERNAGAGLATAGLVLGYLSIILTLAIVGMLLPALPKIKHTVQPTECQRNLREIGLAFKVWALDHNDQYPFNVSTNAGGTRELCAVGSDGFDQNAAAHFIRISNELSTPSFLVCPQDNHKHPAASFAGLQQANVTYLLRTGTNINAENPQQVLAICPIHGNQLFCDGNVRATGRPRRP